MKYTILLTALIATFAQATDWGSYDNYLLHGWEHDAPHIVPHVLPHMHSNPHPDALAYPVYQQKIQQQRRLQAPSVGYELYEPPRW